MPLYEPGPALEQALTGLLRQTYEAYRVVLVDDASTGAATHALLERAARDPRVTVRRNPVRLGLAANWKATFRAARELYPAAEMFAWAGHHDTWEEDWLTAMVARLDANPRAVLAYPLDARMNAAGAASDEGAQPFSTSGEHDPRRRLRACARGVCAGSAIYGLARVAMVERAGVFHRVLRPDRLTLAKLAILGEFEQEPRVLWRRRMTGPPTTRRQRAASFPDRVPVVARLPWPLIHAPLLAIWLVRSRPRPLRPVPTLLATGSYIGRTLVRDAVQWTLDRVFWLEGQMPSRLTTVLRRLLGMAPRRRSVPDMTLVSAERNGDGAWPAAPGHDAAGSCRG